MGVVNIYICFLMFNCANLLFDKKKKRKKVINYEI